MGWGISVSSIGSHRRPTALAALCGAPLMALGLGVAAPAAAQRPVHRGARRRTSAHTATVHAVLRVGTYEGIAGEYESIQAAVDAAKPGDWILIGPGDYKETSSRIAPGAEGDDRPARTSVLITTPKLHVRGMNRNTVMLDGTKPGSPECSSAEADQTFGPTESDGSHSGNNGIVVYKANGVKLQNFSTCNFLGQDAAGTRSGSTAGAHRTNRSWAPGSAPT